MRVFYKSRLTYTWTALAVSAVIIVSRGTFFVWRTLTDVKQLQRRVYLNHLRSYRASGLVCNNPTDPTVPNVATEAAFQCLPSDYRQRACMDGQTEFPRIACARYRGHNMTVLTARTHHTYATNYIPSWDQTARSPTPPLKPIYYVGVKGDSKVSGRQLPTSLLNAMLLMSDGNMRPHWTPAVFNHLLERLEAGDDISPPDYTGAQASIQLAMTHVGVRGRRMLIFGSIAPWAEAIAHHNHVDSTITVDYNTPVSTDSRLEVVLMHECLNSLSTFSVIASFSSIEHDGQGRYGDPLDPDGDLAAMNEAWIKLTPGGVLLLNVPVGHDDGFYWYSQRIYGPARLPLLLRGWTYEGLATSTGILAPTIPFQLNRVSSGFPVFVLRKPVYATTPWIPHVNPDTLQCSAKGVCNRKTM
jgi:hypothetical protein